MMIRVRYEAVDGFRQSRSFKSVAGARRYAVERVGESPEFGSGYAVSLDGVGVIRVEGIALAALFAPPAKPVMEWRAVQVAPGQWEYRCADGKVFGNGGHQECMLYIADLGMQQKEVAAGCFCICQDGIAIGNGYDSKAEALAARKVLEAEGGRGLEIQDWSAEAAESWAAEALEP